MDRYVIKVTGMSITYVRDEMSASGDVTQARMFRTYSDAYDFMRKHEWKGRITGLHITEFDPLM